VNGASQAVVIIAAIAGLALPACAGRRARINQGPGQDLVVLLPEADGSSGRAVVSNASGKVELAAPRDSTVVSAAQPPAPVTRLDPDDIEAIFEDVIAALPPAPENFTLFFQFESDELTRESRALVPQVIEAVKRRPVPDVVVIGHTDTTGTAASNIDLGRKRANAVRDLLLEAGLSRSSIDVVSHGERDLLVKTADGIFEARNRRVEISVR
jgi:outer membrane protein OmpA-like peptidoglycan-associated protein